VVSRLGDLHAVRFEGDTVGVRSAAHAGVERVDRGDLLAGAICLNLAIFPPPHKWIALPYKGYCVRSLLDHR
jgi:hypothetical protein